LVGLRAQGAAQLPAREAAFEGDLDGIPRMRGTWPVAANKDMHQTHTRKVGFFGAQMDWARIWVPKHPSSGSTRNAVRPNITSVITSQRSL
jgi:hypothetical protein